jgi:uncharacterized protein YkwD
MAGVAVGAVFVGGAVIISMMLIDRLPGSDSGAQRSSSRPLTASTAIEPAPRDERALGQMVNAERERHGLRPLVENDQLARVARAYSARMYREGFFGHIDPNGRGPFERLAHYGIYYTLAAENLVVAPTVPQAFNHVLMSRPHRVNVLNRKFCETGIGIYRGPEGLVVTQLFRTWHPYGRPLTGCP